MVSEQAYLILFAGINGAGKTTLFRSGMWEYADSLAGIPRINADEMLVARGDDWHDERAQIRAGREAIALSHGLLESHASFNQETTLAGKTILRTIKEARRRGYWIMLHYVGIASADLACARIAHREELGGHGIDPEVVGRRMVRSLEHLHAAIGFCDDVYLYDNSWMLTPIARFYMGKLAQVYAKLPGIDWYEGYLANSRVNHRRGASRRGYV